VYGTLESVAVLWRLRSYRDIIIIILLFVPVALPSSKAPSVKVKTVINTSSQTVGTSKQQNHVLCTAA